ncbi:MAG: hypothetical protein MnENMB40S_16290 [Rhizobiaceae bacterium MnEN-MB40S]|nr:MAG: hypothetical protein MnENMB40S_16290 [Rhizobiaceae bacterium MnEN-MB40S]
MGKTLVFGAVFATLSILPPAALADENGIECTCVANGERIEIGQVVCLRPGSGKPFMARCERVLNNTSWKRLQDGCPTANLDISNGLEKL